MKLGMQHTSSLHISRVFSQRTNSYPLTPLSCGTSTICFVLSGVLCMPPLSQSLLSYFNSTLSSDSPYSYECQEEWCWSCEKKKKKISNQHSNTPVVLSTSFSFLYPSYLVVWCSLYLLWCVQFVVATCCLLCLYACLHVFVRMCTPLASKWGDKGGAESLMSSLTGRIHVSLFLPANTCCSGWGKKNPI